MALQFLSGQVAVSDPYPNAPTALSGPVKDVITKVVRLTSANFSTSGVNTLVAVLPVDSSIISVQTYVKTALSGNGVTSPTLSLGTASGGTQFTNALAITNTTGTFANASPITNIMQVYNVPFSGVDINIWAGGACSTGNPTAGEIFVVIKYVR
jgi:hypothetical protein